MHSQYKLLKNKPKGLFFYRSEPIIQPTQESQTKKKKNIFYSIGNAFIIISLLGLFFIFLPLITSYIVPEKEINTQQVNFSIKIPKIHAAAPVIENVDPWNETIYKEALKKGVAHAQGTSLPGNNGTIFLFAHSSGAPWEITWSNTIFLRLNELNKNDLIILNRDGKQYKYLVVDKKEIWPNEVNYLIQKNKNQLILQTCTPIGTSLKRLLVFAKPQS